MVGKLAAEDTPKSLNAHIDNLHGVVLDVGPGSGTQLFRFKDAAENISAIYAIEPNSLLHKSLAEKAKEAGLGEKYHIMTCGAESESLIPALHKAGLLKDPIVGESGEPIFDGVSCLLVLCSVPAPQETINGLYKLLKPGGRFTFCEHVVATTPFASFLQKMYHFFGWNTLIGGCHMTRDTVKWLLDAAKDDGGWEEVAIEPSLQNIPLAWVVGTLVKNH
jgi:ubiquinone/menaquinone biosynthesis C-methylase UbiE